MEAQSVARPLETEREVLREVYFAQAETMLHVKIGCAHNAEARLKTLQTGCPDRLILRGVFLTDDAPDLERMFHKHFSHLHLRGEWFKIGPDLESYMADCLFTREAVAGGRIVWQRKASPKAEPVFTFSARRGESARAMSCRLAAEARAAGVEVR